MLTSLFNPIDNLYLNNNTCFLTGADLSSEDECISVFPEWIMERFALRDKPFKMMDLVTGIRYRDITLPCTATVKKLLHSLDQEIQEAFAGGYEGVKNIPEERLFLWMGKIVYGVLYHDLCLEIKRASKHQSGKPFNLSPVLKRRFGLFHLMLQSLVVPISFQGAKPWSVGIVRLKYSRDTFNYRDEPIKLNFSLGMNGFGIVACLQDGGAVARREQPIMRKIGEHILHPIQFEELCGRFLYANYLLKQTAVCDIQQDAEQITIETLYPDVDESLLFSPWDSNMFAQVLTGYWDTWGYTKKNIFSLPGVPISFLENDYTQEFINPETISLPY